MNTQTTSNNGPCIITALITLTLAATCNGSRKDGSGPNSVSLLSEDILWGVNLFQHLVAAY